MISVLLGALSILFVMSTARALWPGCDARAIFAAAAKAQEAVAYLDSLQPTAAAEQRAA